jgi:hypothetical protein
MAGPDIFTKQQALQEIVKLFDDSYVDPLTRYITVPDDASETYAVLDGIKMSVQDILQNFTIRLDNIRRSI